MTTPRIVIPADVMARVTETHERKTAEAQKMIAESLHAVRTQRRGRDRGFFVVLEHSEDVTDEHIAAACVIADDYFGDDESINWSEFYDRLDSSFALGVVNEECKASQQIQRAVREHRRAGA